jgi:hypothetical protein
MYLGDTSSTPLVEMANMSATEIAAYNAGYDWNEEYGGKKNWD